MEATEEAAVVVGGEESHGMIGVVIEIKDVDSINGVDVGHSQICRKENPIFFRNPRNLDR